MRRYYWINYHLRYCLKTFSKEDERKSTLEIWEGFLKFPELPILENEDILKNTIAKGVQEEAFGL